MIRDLSIALTTNISRQPKPSERPGLPQAFSRMMSASSSANQFRKVVLGLEVRLTSSDWEEIFKSPNLKKVRLFYIVASWLPRRAASFMSNQFKRKPMPSFYTAMVIRKNLIKVRGGKPSHKSKINLRSHTLLTSTLGRAEDLLLIWTSSRGRPQMPLATFVQATSHRNCDILVFRPQHGSYKTGIHGWGTNVNEVYSSIESFVAAEGYKRVYVLGTSLGSVPALLGSQLPGVSQVLLVGPIDPRREYKTEFENLQVTFAKSGLGGKVTSVTGSLSAADNQVAEFLETTLGTCTVTISGTGHNPLWPLVVQGKISPWLDLNFFEKSDIRKLPN